LTTEQFKQRVEGITNDYADGVSDRRHFHDEILDLLLEVCKWKLEPAEPPAGEEPKNILATMRLYGEEHGFDGLYNAEVPCGCLFSDMCPCYPDGNIGECSFGYKGLPPAEEMGGEYDGSFWIYGSKTKAEASKE